MLGLYFRHFQLCNLVPLQRYTKALSTLQRSSLVEKSRQKPQERMIVLSDVSVSIASS
jgi:eukaryotic translation initiation factor 2C